MTNPPWKKATSTIVTIDESSNTDDRSIVTNCTAVDTTTGEIINMEVIPDELSPILTELH